MFRFINRNPLKQVQLLRDKAERIGLAHLEQLAVTGKITRPLILQMARSMNEHPDEIIERIPDRRRPGRYAKAMAGLRAANLVNERQSYGDHFDPNS